MNNENNELIHIKNTLDGDKKAFAYLVDQYKQLVFALAMKMLADSSEAEDICQEVFLRVYKKLNQFKVKYRFKDWLYAVAVNVITDKLRRKKILLVSLDKGSISEDGDVSELSVPDHTQNPELISINKERKDEIVKCINSLPVKYKLVVVLRYIDSLSYQEIAQAMSIPLGTVKTFIYRAQKIISKKMKHFYGSGRINK